jgi:hypothetical protein
MTPVNTYVATTNAGGHDTLRLGDDDLHRAAIKTMHAGHHEIFRTLPGILGRIIEHKIWKTRTKSFSSFGEYALDHTSEGLGIINNQLLWMLKCGLDVHGAHIKEWASVLEHVEKAVKIYAKSENRKIRDFNGNSLETLGKACLDQDTARITYLPSRNKNEDGNILRLKHSSPDNYRLVVSGQMTVRDAVRSAKQVRSPAQRQMDSSIKSTVRERATKEVAAIIFENVPKDLLPAIKANLQVSGPPPAIAKAIEVLEAKARFTGRGTDREAAVV